MKKLEDFIKHSPHCLAGKYSTMGRCSCGAQAALEELAALRKAAQHSVEPTSIPRMPIDDFVRVLKRNIEEDN